MVLAQNPSIHVSSCLDFAKSLTLPHTVLPVDFSVNAVSINITVRLPYGQHLSNM